MKNIKQWLAYKILREFYKFLVWVARCLPSMIRSINDLVRDEWLGIETSDSCQFKDYSLHKDSVNYVPSPYHITKKIIDYLNLGPDDVFEDFGCGKGRAVFVASLGKLKKAVGIDIDKDIIEIAQKNLHSIKAPHAPIEFICADAACFDVTEGTVFYMYHPFGYNTTKTVIENIRTSLVSVPRRIRIVLYCPSYRDIFDQQKWLELEKEMNKGSIVILRNIHEG